MRHTHKCFPRPTSTFSLLGYQCGCGRYFRFKNKKEYFAYLDKNHKGWRKTERGKLVLSKFKSVEKSIKEWKEVDNAEVANQTRKDSNVS